MADTDQEKEKLVQPMDTEKRSKSEKRRSTEEGDSDHYFTVMCAGMQAMFLILFAVGGEYRREPNPEPSKFSMYQDIHGMMFVGFGFLMTYLRRYAFGSIAFNFLLCATCIQWQLIMFGAICQGWNANDKDLAWGEKLRKYTFSMDSLADADLGTAAMLISMGAVLGRTNPSQLLFMVLIEVPLYAINFYVLIHYLKVTDVGGSITIHVFGCYFGLAVSYVLGKPENTDNNKSMYHSDLFSMIGTLFLWLYWPSFNAYYAYQPMEVDTIKTHGGDKTRAYVNTIISLCAATLATFIFSKIFKKGKLEMVHIQNATLAGGVVMGACADLYTHPAGAVAIGFAAGTLSTFGFWKIQDALMSIGLYDTCGVHNLHGMPGVLGCIASAITAGSYDDSVRFNGRTQRFVGSFQIAGLCVTWGIAILGGLCTGVLMKIAFPSPRNPYTDLDNFHVPIKTADFFRGTIRGKKGGAVKFQG